MKNQSMNTSAKLLIKKAILRRWHSQCAELYDKIKCFYTFATNIGLKVKCPFCQWRFKRFLPGGRDVPILQEMKVIGAGHRPGVFCPLCHSTDRERLIYLYLKDELGLFSERPRILHFAPERNLGKVLRDSFDSNYLSADIYSSRAMKQIDITNIELTDNQFDLIVCNHVLEHIPDDRRAMMELYRILKPGGRAILQVPISLSLEKTLENDNVVTLEDREKYFGQYDHVRIYARDYEKRLREAGFTVVVFDLLSSIGEKEYLRYGCRKEETIYICSKPDDRDA